MNAKALVCDEKQEFSYADVVLPDPGPEHIVIRALYSGVSIGTEFALIRNKLSWGPYPLCTGYQAVGVVESAGKKVGGFKKDDKIYYRQNKKMEYPDGTSISPVAGTHCSHAVIDAKDTVGVATIPEGIDDASASLFVMPAVGLHGVNMTDPGGGETVLVHGAGLIGLGVIAACKDRGCVVIAVDLDAKRLGVAKKLGADHIIDASTEDVPGGVKLIVPDGADVVFESTGVPACIDKAIELCRPLGKFVWQGNYGAEPVSMHFLPPHERQLTMIFPCDDGQEPCRQMVLDKMASGALPWHLTITHRVDAEDSPALYDNINKGKANDVIGAIINWS